MSIANVKRWEPRTSYVRGDQFKFRGTIYEVKEAFVSGIDFDYNDDRYEVTAAPHITKLEVIDGVLTAFFEDSSEEPIGRMEGGGGGPSYYGVIERLVVTGANTLSTPNNEIDTTEPVKVTVNHTTYFSVEQPAPFTVATDAITWNETNAGFALDMSDSVVIEYTKAL